MEDFSILAVVAIGSGILSLVCLLLLHFTSREFEPNWRMISEYALGKYKWLLTSFFTLWSISSISTACLLLGVVTSGWAMFGLLLVFVSGIGSLMGGLFDVKHKLHGLSFALGVPTLPAGALFVSYHLVHLEGWNLHRLSLLLAAHAPWICVVLMAFSMMLLFSGFKKAGLTMGPNVEPPKTLPKGVIGVAGYANRLLVLCYIGWLIVVAQIYLSLVHH